MRETQFYICLAVTLGLLLLVIPVIFLLKKRLPTIQKKIFFAQVWLASMVVVLMPLYYHFYKVAMYYSMCLFIFALSLVCAFIILSKLTEPDNFIIASNFSLIKNYLLSISIIIIALMLFFVPEYLFNHALNSEKFYDYGVYIYFLSILLSVIVLCVNCIYIFGHKTISLVIFINIFLSFMVIIPLFLFGSQFFNHIKFPYKIILNLFPSITILIPSISLFISNKKNSIHKALTFSSFLYLLISISYFLFHQSFVYTEIDKVPTNLTTNQFSIIVLLNLALIIPFLLMSYAIVFRNKTQPTQIGNEPANMS